VVLIPTAAAATICQQQPAGAPLQDHPQKSLPRQTIYRQKSAPPGGRPSGTVFTGELSAGETFLGGDRITGNFFYGGRRYFSTGKTNQFRDFFSPDRFFRGETF